jgi:hypothetical protein
MKRCNLKAINFYIFIIYNVQYVVVTYVYKIKWIFVFAKQKWAACILKTLEHFMFIKVQLKKTDFINFLFKLNLYVFSLRSKEFENWKYDIYIYNFKSFKDGNILFAYVCKYCFENG